MKGEVEQKEEEEKEEQKGKNSTDRRGERNRVPDAGNAAGKEGEGKIREEYGDPRDGEKLRDV